MIIISSFCKRTFLTSLTEILTRFKFGVLVSARRDYFQEEENIFCVFPYIISYSVCIYLIQGFPCSSVGKDSACNAGDPGSIPGLGRFLGEGNDNPLQYFAWRIHGQRSLAGYTVHGVTRVGHNLSTKPPPQNILLLLAADKFASFLSSGSTTLYRQGLTCLCGQSLFVSWKRNSPGQML